ncbi:ECF transporter S component [Streptomyces tateyamensis]|uniref:ECF transporter S component n=1 Tax=Streptomyces tateyamensis TaxID=565073 RepID=A0A2V4NNF3_9ACTN|nr:ECF transporter S component [Streptomyces tateyamensis]PYC77295.1 ECF transporter S component [Streptomyces tateyamensis]
MTRLGPRAALALLLVSLVGLAAFGWPLLAGPHSAVVGHAADAPWLFALLLPLLLAVLVAQISEAGLDPKAVAVLGVLAAAGAALRPLGAGTAGLEPMFFLMVLAGRVLGPANGFVLGAITLPASALLTGGVGPWLPFQMLAMGWVCVGAGLVPGPVGGRAERLLLAGYGALAAIGYGTVMNLQGWPYLAGLGSSVSFVPGDPVSANLPRFALYCLTTSLGWDLPRAALTAVLCVLAGGPVLRALRRAVRRAAFAAPVAFRPAADPGDPAPAREPRPGAVSAPPGAGSA